MFAKLVNMAKTPDEVKKDFAEYPSAIAGGSTKPTGPMYPYGLCVSLEDATLTKLGLDGDMPGVGDIIQFNAIAKVTSVSENEREATDGTKSQCKRVELQITDMGIPGTGDDDRSAERRQRFYGDSMKADVSNDG